MPGSRTSRRSYDPLCSSNCNGFLSLDRLERSKAAIQVREGLGCPNSVQELLLSDGPQGRVLPAFLE